MIALNATQVLVQITNSLSDISKVTLETSYSLVLVIDSDKSLTLHQTTAKKPGLDGENDGLPNPDPDPEHKQLGYKYRVFPDYGAGFVWYDPAWSGNPKDSSMVDEEELQERYGDAWNKAYNSWMDWYTAAFQKQECHLGSHNHPFPGHGRAEGLGGGRTAIGLLVIPPARCGEY
ncbi:hypothetical protein PG994_006524 [Apiospora phragmitis]|uniref:Uncharacterized protein n=1 Tax=Apiospora phragmitis TaxID=2905665 RepID=A0ABR1VFE0_9PEZI